MAPARTRSSSSSSSSSNNNNDSSSSSSSTATSSLMILVVVTITTVVVGGVVAATYVVLTNKKNKNEGQETKDRLLQQSGADAALLTRFQNAATAVSKTSSSFSNGDKLMLYGLYKQATVGDAPQVGPSLLNMVAYAKFSTWSKFKGMSQIDAMNHYIEALTELAAEHQGTSTSNDYNDMEGPALGLGLQPSKPMEEEDEVEMNSDSLEARLRNAAATDNVGTMKELVEQGATVNAADDHGETALHFCADRGMLDGVTYLLDHGADPNVVDHDGISALQAAVIAGHIDVCQALLAAGADPDKEDADGDSPRVCAQDDPSVEMQELFAKYSSSQE